MRHVKLYFLSNVKENEGVHFLKKAPLRLLPCLFLFAALCSCAPAPPEPAPAPPAVSSVVLPTAAPSAAPTGDLPSDSTFSVRFIDVGQADAALVQCDGSAMLIDGGNVGDSSRIVSILKAQDLTALDAVVCTHAHEDHVGGLAGALHQAAAAHVYAPQREYDSDAFRAFLKYTEAQGREVEIPEAGTQFSLGSAEVSFLGPVRDYEETNNTSLVLRVVYGETSFLFTGDMEREAEADLLADGAELKSTVLKVGHHGSDTSSSYPFLRAVAPEYAVISVGAGNSYGHPTDDVLSRLRDCGAAVYRTDLQGDILCTSDGRAVTFTTARAPAVETPPKTSPAAEYSYIGNKNSKVLHLPTCHTLPKESNRIYFSSRDEAISAGYRPGGCCDP